MFDDSLSEPRKTGKDTPVKEKLPESSVPRSDHRKHSKEKRNRAEEEGEYDLRGSHSKHRNRHSSYGSRDEDDISLPRASRIHHRQKPHKTSQERRQSTESNHRDSPTRGKQIRRSSIVDSPTLRRKKPSDTYSTKIKEKMPQECVQELNEVLQHKEAKQGKVSKKLSKTESPKNPETPSSKPSSKSHRREPSILKMDDIKNSQGKSSQPKATTTQAGQKGHQRSSSDDSQGMQTIPVIKARD